MGIIEKTRLQFIVSGTDTGIGKTLLCSLLMAALPDYAYWKPIQSGTIDGIDSETVRELSGCLSERILPEAYRFTQPLSPHLAAKLDGMEIDSARLALPKREPLIVEGAGGLLVPLTNDLLYIDVFQRWGLPVLLACRSSLGTINHSLLSIEALRNRKIPMLGCILIGEPNPENERAIEFYGKTKVLGRIPHLSVFTSENLRAVYRDHLHGLSNLL